MNPLRAFMLVLTRLSPATMLFIVVGVAGLGAYLIHDAMNQKDRQIQQTIELANATRDRKGTAVFATKDIPEGATIPAECLEEKQLELSKIPLDALSSTTIGAGRIAKYGIQSGQIVSQHDLAPSGVKIGFEAKLREGMRAVTFAVDTNSGVAGFVAPNSRVDVMAMVGAGQETKAAPILSDVEVIAVGQIYQRENGSTAAIPASSVTVALSPEDTVKLIKGVSASKLYLALRNDKDHTPVATIDVTSLFRKPTEGNLPLTASNLIPPPSGLLPMEMPKDTPTTDTTNGAPPIPVLQHEIELWSGSKKDVLTVPKG